MDKDNTSDTRTDALRKLQKNASDFLKPFLDLARIKSSDPDLPASLEKALGLLPSPEGASQTVSILRDRTRELSAALRTAREKAFGATLTAFIRDHGAKVGSRETDNAWRIGRIELAFRRELAQVRILYNRKPLCDWQPVDSPEKLAKLVVEAEGRLDKVAVAPEVLVDVFWRAYRYLHQERLQAKKSRPDEVPIREFYAEVRVALVRSELRGSKPDRKLTWTDFPEWAFLYNLDRYVAPGSSIPAERRLRLQTGGQQDEARGMGMTVGGLKPEQDYKSFCYVVGPAQQ